jgi:hypothetical protein
LENNEKGKIDDEGKKKKRLRGKNRIGCRCCLEMVEQQRREQQTKESYGGTKLFSNACEQGIAVADGYTSAGEGTEWKAGPERYSE